MEGQPKIAVVSEIIGKTGSRGAIDQVRIQFTYNREVS